MPNTTHYWKSLPPATPWSMSGPGVANPVIPVGTLFNTGKYVDSAVRGACLYLDTIDIFMDVTPAKPIITWNGAKCPGEDDTISASSTLPAGGDYWFFANPPSGPVGPLAPPNNGNQLFIPGIQPADEARYYVYAQSPNGCISDTAYVDVTVNPPATAAFTFTEKLGCDGDTVEFHNFSIGGNTYTWDFGNGSPQVTSKQPDTMYIYKNHPSMPITYNVKLRVGNGSCADDTSLNISFNHPIEALYTASDSEICQYQTITFVNNSISAPATIPNYRWLFGDGDSSTAVLGVDHQYNRVGTYKTLLEITDFLGCKDTFIKEILVDSVGSISFSSNNTSICAGESVDFTGTYSPFGITNAVWNFDDGNTLYNTNTASHSFLDGGTYKVSFSADYRICPDTTYSVDLNVIPYPVVDLGNDTTICPNGEPVRINAFVAGTSPDVKYRWNTEIKDSTQFIYAYHPGMYAVTADINGCKTTDSIMVYKKCYVDVPNVFTPNGDGTNDYFLPRELMSRGLSKFRMTIFNRWGGKVFETTSINGRGWDGKFNDENEPNGVYVYLIEATFINGDSEKYQGNITLLR
jgi:gliding motility-associated-like protein